MELTKPIVAFGGTFDPIHLGHLHIIEKIWEILAPEKILLIPCNQSPVRDQTITPASDRLLMARLAIETLEVKVPIVVDDREIARGGYSYAIDTLRSLREEYGMKKPLCLLLGSDAFNGITNWLQWQEIIKLAHIVVVDRLTKETYDHSAELDNFLQEHLISDKAWLNSDPFGHILLVDIEPLAISATEIRELIKVNQMTSVYARNYLTPNVWQYICNNNLYK